MNQILIVFYEKDLKPVGGPAGYLYNFYKELEREKRKEVVFLQESNKKKRKWIRNIYLKIPKFIRKWIQTRRNCNKYKNALMQKSKKIEMNLEQFHVLHFHSTWSMYLYREELEQFEGIIILTSHTPVVPYKEIIEEIIPQKEYRKNKEVYDNLEKIDHYAFSKADFIIFPCKEAEEPYYHTWDKYSVIRDEQKYHYLLTGIPDCRKKLVESIDIRQKYKVPKDAFIISYIGRHNKVKGYDILKIIGEKILQIYDNVYFLVAGVEEPICGLKNQHWIEIGWTNNPYSIIEASDLFILPNRETFFDLILLEVLSLGKNVLISWCGGNKKFADFNSEGILFFHNVDEALKQIKYLYTKDRKERIRMGYENRQIYEKYFTIQKFTKDYLEMIDDIVKSTDKRDRIE